LQDSTTGSWSLFAQDARLIAINAARFDASKHMALAVVGDAREGLLALGAAVEGWRAGAAWGARAASLRAEWGRRPEVRGENGLPSYAQIVGVVNRSCADADRVVTAAGGLPGEVAANWRARSIASVDIEYGYSCMGYEIAGGWGARIAQMEQGGGGDVIVFVGDGSYLMLNSDIYSSVLTGRKLIIILCDNGGFAVIDKLQRNTGNVSFNNQIADCTLAVAPFAVDFAAHARSMGADAESVTTLDAFEAAFARAKSSQRTCLIEVKVDPRAWTEGGHAWWDIGTPEVSRRAEVRAAAADAQRGRDKQRRGV
jgi:3D-(3,5/4)-trihydroxycyclohexane-1,2-dione acylhydrolase (decyclizing)